VSNTPAPPTPLMPTPPMTTDSLTSSTLSTVRSASQVKTSGLAIYKSAALAAVAQVLVADAGSFAVSNPLRPSSLDRQDAPPALPSAPSMKRNTTLPRQESKVSKTGAKLFGSLLPGLPMDHHVCAPNTGEDIIVTDHCDHGPSPGAASLDLSAADAVKPATHRKKPRRQASEIRRTGIIIELHLWRADLLSSLLEVQPSGKICNANINKLCPPGLVLGCSSDSLVTRNVSSLLHHNGQLADLFNEPQEASVRGLLRKNTRNDKQVGPMHVLRTTHLGDATELEVAVQIIRRAPPSSAKLLRPDAPSQPKLRTPRLQGLARADGPGSGPSHGHCSQLIRLGLLAACGTLLLHPPATLSFPLLLLHPPAWNPLNPLVGALPGLQTPTGRGHISQCNSPLPTKARGSVGQLRQLRESYSGNSHTRPSQWVQGRCPASNSQLLWDKPSQPQRQVAGTPRGPSFIARKLLQEEAGTSTAQQPALQLQASRQQAWPLMHYPLLPCAWLPLQEQGAVEPQHCAPNMLGRPMLAGTTGGGSCSSSSRRQQQQQQQLAWKEATEEQQQQQQQPEPSDQPARITTPVQPIPAATPPSVPGAEDPCHHTEPRTLNAWLSRGASVSSQQPPRPADSSRQVLVSTPLLRTRLMPTYALMSTSTPHWHVRMYSLGTWCMQATAVADGPMLPQFLDIRLSSVAKWVISDGADYPVGEDPSLISSQSSARVPPPAPASISSAGRYTATAGATAASQSQAAKDMGPDADKSSRTTPPIAAALLDIDISSRSGAAWQPQQAEQGRRGSPVLGTTPSPLGASMPSFDLRHLYPKQVSAEESTLPSARSSRFGQGVSQHREDGDEGVGEASSSSGGGEGALSLHDLAPDLADAAAHLADEAGALDHASDQPSESGGGGDRTAAQQGDFRRGKRLRRLLRQLHSVLTQHVMHRFRWQSLALVLLLVAIHVGMCESPYPDHNPMPGSSCPACLLACLAAVALVYSLIQEQQVKVQDFTQTAHAAQNIARVATLALNIDIFVNKRTVPGLEGLEGPQDLAVTLDDMMDSINDFTALHSGSYLGFHSRRQLPDEFGIRRVWEVDGCNCTIFYDSLPLPSSKTRVMGLWDAGNLFTEQALWVWQRWPQRAQDVSVSREPWSSWGPVQFLLVGASNDAEGAGGWGGPSAVNSVNSLYSAYYNTMDGLTQILIADFSKVNNVQLLIMVMEGVVLCLIVFVYLWVLLSQVNAQRCSLYCSFLLVPLALVRSIINRPLGLEEDSEEEEEDEAQAQAVLAPGGAAPGDTKQGGVEVSQESGGGSVAPGPLVSGMSMTRAQMWDNSGDSKERRWLGGEAGQVLRRLMFWRPPQVLPTLSGSKRTLHTSNKQLVWQLWPFLAWGVLIIILHNVAMAGLHTISGPLATLNIVNFVDMRNARTFLIAQELVWETNVTILAQQRTAMTRYMGLLRQEYHAMFHPVLLQGVPQLDSLHYTQATQGLAFVGGKGAAPPSKALLPFSPPPPFPTTHTPATWVPLTPLTPLSPPDLPLPRGSLCHPTTSKPKSHPSEVLSMNPLLTLCLGADHLHCNTSPQGTDILYKPGRCLRLNQSSCLGPDSPFYHYTVNGLDTLMQQSFVAMEALANTTGAEPYLWDPSFKFLAATRLDREGGLDALNAAYQQHLGGTYTASLQVHVVALVLTLLLMLGYLLFIWRPFLKEVSQEMRRVAELLNQLPLDSQPEALLQRSLFAYLGQGAAATARVSGGGAGKGGAGASSTRSMDSSA
ncbi:hypothetical protein QJQ45_025103, partial [Haematococcus lacustris]